MHRTHVVPSLLALLITLAPSAGAADDSPGSTAPSDAGPRSSEEPRLRAVAGAFDGLGVRRASGPVVSVDATWAPRVTLGDWGLRFPLALAHRQTFGEHLDQTEAGAGVDARYGGGTYETGPLAGFSYTWRPGWPDLYKLDAGGRSLPTDRYSHSHGFVGWQHWSKLGGGNHLRLKARYIWETYVHDPAYDPTVSHVHLAPRDHQEVRVDASLRHVSHWYAWALRLTAFDRKYGYLYVRRANTGATVVSSGLQEQQWIEPRAEVELRSRPANLTVGAGLPLQRDPFEGYYSYVGFRPYAELKGALTHSLSYEAKASARLLTYGPNSKSVTADGLGGFVPGTDDGKRLWYRSYGVEGELKYRLVKGFALVVNGEWKRRETNFRDYVPGVYPPPPITPRPYNTNYDIQWDYTNWMVTGGIEWSPPAKAEKGQDT